MTKKFNVNTENKDEWLTPPELIRALGSFDLDPCAPINRPWDTAAHHYTIDDAGLDSFWYGRVWLNPPYGKYMYQWLEKLAEHKRGIALIFNRSDTIGYHEQVLKKCHSIFCLKGRSSFYEQFFEDVKGKWFNTRTINKNKLEVAEIKRLISIGESHKNVPIYEIKLTGNTKWDNPDPAAAPSVLISYSDADTITILDSGLEGELLIPDSNNK